MNHIKVQLSGKQADRYVIPLGPVSLVNVVTDVGMVGCGAFDVAALNNFGYPAAEGQAGPGKFDCHYRGPSAGHSQGSESQC